MSTKKLQILDYTVKQADNADTVDGKHAADFASATDMAAAQSDISNLQSKVGDTAVSSQITTAIDGLATETYVDTKVAGIVNSAPETLDTLNELAAALGNDPNFATTVATQIGTKVDKVSGKGLSTNDYTTTEKNKLAGIASGATANSASATTPKAAGTASVGSETAYARGDHVHPAQTTVSGNSGSSTKLATARTIQTNLASTSSASFDGTSDITPGVTGTLPIANGGTGATTASNALTKLGGAKVDLTNVTDANFLSKAQASGASIPVVTTSGSGYAYTATVPGVTEIETGVMFIMIPHTDSTSVSPRLNVNGLGGYSIMRRTSGDSELYYYGSSLDWLQQGHANLMMFIMGKWVALDLMKPSADDLTGVVPISRGGTGASNADSAVANLGIADYIVEQVISPTGWTYRKWNSGLAECWGRYIGNVNAAANNWSGFYYSGALSVDFPFAFKSIESIHFDGGSNDYLNFARNFASTLTQARFIIAGHSADATNVGIDVSISVKGTWK